MQAPDLYVQLDPAVRELALLLWGAHRHMREALRQSMQQRTQRDLSAVAGQAETDIIYGIDRIAEESLLEFLHRHQAEAPSFLLVGEFETGEVIPFGQGEAQFRVLFDPIDGTRLVMYSKSSGWILSGILPERGEDTRLAEVVFSLQTEIPLPKYLFADTLWAAKRQGSFRMRENLITGKSTTSRLQGNQSAELLHGFMSFVKLFPLGKQMTAAIEEDFLERALGHDALAPAAVFEDQHLSTSGQLYALIEGQLRMVVDIRPSLNRRWRRANQPTVLCAHPYDLATWLIAQEAGVAMMTETGEPFDGAATATAEVGWIGFQSRDLAERYGDMLLQTLRDHGLL